MPVQEFPGNGKFSAPSRCLKLTRLGERACRVNQELTFFPCGRGVIRRIAKSRRIEEWVFRLGLNPTRLLRILGSRCEIRK